MRRWAASAGLTSADALAQWLDTITPDRVAQLGPYEEALVRALQQYAMATQADGSLPAPWRLASYYRPVLGALDAPDVERQLNTIGASDAFAAEWIDPLINPLAPEAGLFWPASPATVTARMAQAVYDAFGYRPLDARAFLVSLATSEPRDPTRRRTAGDEVGAQLRDMGETVATALGGLLGLRADPRAPPLAPVAAVDAARLRWPSVTTEYIEPPFVVAVGAGLFHGAPSHVVWLRQRDGTIGGVVVDDATGRVVDEDGVAARDQPDLGFGVYAQRSQRARRAIDQASGGQPDTVAEWLATFARAARDRETGAAGLSPVALFQSPVMGWIGHDVEQIDYARVAEPAEVLAALSAETRSRAARAMQRTLASIGGLARRAAEAYTGDIMHANVPDEVRQLLAVQAASRACASEAPAAPSQRKTLVDAAGVVGLLASDDSTVESLCVAAAQAAERLYGMS